MALKNKILVNSEERVSGVLSLIDDELPLIPQLWKHHELIGLPDGECATFWRTSAIRMRTQVLIQFAVCGVYFAVGPLSIFVCSMSWQKQTSAPVKNFLG